MSPSKHLADPRHLAEPRNGRNPRQGPFRAGHLDAVALTRLDHRERLTGTLPTVRP